MFPFKEQLMSELTREEVDQARAELAREAVREAYLSIFDDGYKQAIADAMECSGDPVMLFEDLEAAGLVDPEDYPEFWNDDEIAA
jgi:hypothetical protein